MAADVVVEGEAEADEAVAEAVVGVDRRVEAVTDLERAEEMVEGHRTLSGEQRHWAIEAVDIIMHVRPSDDGSGSSHCSAAVSTPLAQAGEYSQHHHV